MLLLEIRSERSWNHFSGSSCAIRVNDRLLKDFVHVYSRQAFCGSQKQLDQMLRQVHHLTSVLPAARVVAGPISQPPWRKRFEMRLARYSAISTSSEAANLRDARAFYKFNRRIRVPATIGSGIWMDFRLLSSSRVRTSGDGSSPVTQ